MQLNNGVRIMSKSKVYIRESITEKIQRHAKIIIESILEYPDNCAEFGKEAANIILKRKCTLVSTEKYVDFIADYLANELQAVLNKYRNHTITSHQKPWITGKYPIWVCWLQGEANMPEICRICVDRIRKNAPPNAEVVFITYDNYLSYLEIPKEIVKKHEEGKICPTNYTDLIRYGLLATYGGAWIDSGVFFTGDILEKAVEYEIFTPKFHSNMHEDASRGKWIGGCWFSKKGNILFDFTYDSLIYFWQHHNKAIDYLAADYVLWIAYSELEEARQLVDSIPYNNENFRLLNNHLHLAYDRGLYQNIISDCQIHIINRHPNYPEYDADGRPTFYDQLISGNLD